jgi:hypothetical protein
LQRSDFEAPQYRRLLNQLAGLLMWGPHQNSDQCLAQARIH